MDRYATKFFPLAKKASWDFLKNSRPEFKPLSTGHIPLDADVTPMDNSRTRKEGVSRTYKGCDGFAPMAVYLGQEGYCIDLELREGKQHCQKGTPDLLAHAEQQGCWSEPRAGNRVALFSISHERTWREYQYQVHRVMRVIERTIDKHGRSLLVPEIEIAGWWTSLDLKEEEVIHWYADHGTSEQFHSELKTDLDIERLPSGKFDTNALVLGCSMLAYNLLRWIGQNGLLGPRSPQRNKAKRRRLKTVMQELMYLTTRVVRTARYLKLVFGKRCRAVDAFTEVYEKLAYG